VMKRLCTATIFLALIGGIAGLFFVSMSDNVWWLHYHGIGRVALAGWILMNILLPVAALACAGGVVWSLWFFAEYVCMVLRKSIAGRRKP
jgi:hypothetical protein